MQQHVVKFSVNLSAANKFTEKTEKVGYVQLRTKRMSKREKAS